MSSTRAVHPYPKCPIPKDNNNEIDNIDQEHDGIDIAYWAVLWVYDIIEELSDRQVDL